MLSDQEQRAWKEIERSYAAEAGERDGTGGQPWTRRSRGGDGVRALAIGGVCIAIMFVLVGAPVAGLGIGAAAALGWLLWRYWPELGRACTTTCLPMVGGLPETGGTGQEPGDDASPGRPRRRPEAD
ncbi:hypothetical protein [Geodermatophilus sp. URMC 64]